jgi:Ca2+-binding EF-hand superfamily protein
MSDSEVQELREIFNLVDLDGGGTISKDELATLMLSLGLEASKARSRKNVFVNTLHSNIQADVTNIVNEIDSKGTGEIDFESNAAHWLVGLFFRNRCAGFVLAMSRKAQLQDSQQRVKVEDMLYFIHAPDNSHTLIE